MPKTMPRRRVESENKQPAAPPDVKQKLTLPKCSSSKSTDDMRNHHYQQRRYKLAKLGRSHSSPTPASGAEDKDQIEMLSPKANSTSGDSGGGGDEMAKPSKSTIRWMWKNAFKSLKMRDRDKEKSERGERDKDRDDRTSDKSSDREEKKYSRMVSECFYPLSLHMSFTDKQFWPMNSRQSSLKKSSAKQKDTKEQTIGEEGEPVEITDEVGEIDPVYSLLKCAADLPRQSKQPGGGLSAAGLNTTHACCTQRATELLTVRADSRSSSPSSEPVSPSNLQGDASSLACTCPCHTPELLAGYHLSLLNSFVIKKS